MEKNKHKETNNTYSSINEWYGSQSGCNLSYDIASVLSESLSQCFGYYAVQIGCSNLANNIVKKSRVRHSFLLDQFESDVLVQHQHLPIANDSVDLVVAAHCLSYSKHPHALLREIDRIMVPEAKLLIVEFNPLSLWGMRHALQAWLEKMPWTGRLFTSKRVDDWLSILGYKKVELLKAHYDLPLQLKSQNVLSHGLSKAMKRWLPFMSAVNIFVYEKTMIPMTPIKTKWQRPLLNGGRLISPYAGRHVNK